MTVDIAVDGATVTVTDTVEQRRCTFRTPSPTSVTPTDGDRFYFPVDAAVRVDAGTVTLPNYVATFVRNADGDMLAEIDHVDEQRFGEGTYSIELDESIKLYLRVEGPMTVSTSGIATTVESEQGTLRLGARSRHNRPAGTITTTGDPEDLMAAVSAFTAALKTTSCERAYPTLRGHPPELELGDELHIPEELAAPAHELRIEVPPSRSYIYPLASLAFYLGAEVVPGTSPRIVGDDFEYGLVGAEGFETTVEQTLKQVFLFDCVTRTEGFYAIDLHERRELEARVDLDWEELYDAPLAEQLETYLSVPFEEIHDLVPEWKVTTHLAATPENAELLPFLVNDLAVIRLPAGQSVSSAEAQVASITEFARAPGASSATAADEFAASDFTRSASATESGVRTNSQGPGELPLVQPERTDSIEQIWADENAPVGATKASVQAFRNGLTHDPSPEIGVTVVVNDGEMADEGDVAQSVYGDDADFPFDLRVYNDLSTEALRAVLETDRDFLHYVGHIDADGFECADGKLDARELETVGVDAFFLNACSSYEQGMALLDRGAVGGVVTLSDVINSGAARVGKSMVKLLNNGFPLRPALDVAKDESFVGGQYIVVGDGNVDIVQGSTLSASLLNIEERDEEYALTLYLYLTRESGLGTFTTTYNAPKGRYYLASGPVETFVVSKEEMRDTLDSFDIPVRYDGELRWSHELEL